MNLEHVRPDVNERAARLIAESIYLDLIPDLRLLRLLCQGRYSVPLDSEALAALEVAVIDALERHK